jgi:hypothetical protein
VKSKFSALSVFVLALGALAMQSCESTDGQNSYYNRDHTGYYSDGRYSEENGYYHQRRYVPVDYQSDRPSIDLHEQVSFNGVEKAVNFIVLTVGFRLYREGGGKTMLMVGTITQQTSDYRQSN